MVNVYVIKVDFCVWFLCFEDFMCSCVDWQNYMCFCNKGFKCDGFNCIEIDECDLNLCSYGGMCYDYVNYYNCMCFSGYYNGLDCIFINYCFLNLCQYDLVCDFFLNKYKCYCLDGYIG